VDSERFRPLEPGEREDARRRFGLAPSATVVLGLSRLVPRKGFDVLLRAAGRLAPTHPQLVVAIAGSGRDRRRLEQVARRAGAPARFLGRVPEADLPALYGAADVFAMLARSRWGGLEQEGFGIVFLEAAAAGVPQLGGASGGVPEAVLDGRTGLLVDPPGDLEAATSALASLLDDATLRACLGANARRRAVTDFDRDELAGRLHEALSRLP
jgi:phosphatidylinositol alpha-1,6-mannosyltransferase